MNKKETFNLAFTGIMIALLTVLAQVPFLGFIQIPGIGSATTLIIPVIIVVMLVGLKYGLLMGLFFGINSLIVAYMRPTGAFDLAFQNPVLAILPRVLFIIPTYYIFKGLEKLKVNNIINYVVTAGLGSLLHSVFVLVTAGLLFSGVTFGGTDFAALDITWNFLVWVFTAFSLIEAAISAVIIPLVAQPLFILKKQRDV